MSKARIPYLSDRVAGAILVAGLLLLLEGILRVTEISSLILVPPSQVLIAFWNGLTQGMYGLHLRVTLIEMLSGFAIGSLCGLLSGMLITEFGRLGRLLYPYLIAIQSLPKVAIAPLLIIWLGYGLSSKIVLVALITFFPVLINTMAGLSVVDQLRLDLMATLNASRWQTFIYVRLPSAATHIFAGLGVAIVLALTGAVVAEFVGAQQGLGVLLLQAQANLDTAGMFAILIILAAIGLGCNLAIRMLERKLLYWIDHHNQKEI